MTGHIRRRGKGSWELKFDVSSDELLNRRKTRYQSFKGTKRDAELELARLTLAARRSDYVDPSKVLISTFLDQWERDWLQHNLSGKAAERYRELLRLHIRPALGHVLLQKLRPVQLSAHYATLLAKGTLSAATVGYVHRVVHRALGHAKQWGLVSANAAETVSAPRHSPPEVAILTEAQVKDVLEKLRGRDMYFIAALGLSTGARRGEMLALRWKDVDLTSFRIRIERSLEQTKAGLKFKEPKTKRGRRSISLPFSVASDLAGLRRTQLTQRMALGLGREEEDALVFSSAGAPLNPNSVSKEWRRLIHTLGLPNVTMHAWRHTHASQLIAARLDVVTISRRLGHAAASITLDVYGHLFSDKDDGAAAVFEAAYGQGLAERKQK